MNSFEKAVELIEKSDIENLKKLIEEDRSILDEKDKDGRTILHIAIREDRIDISKLLILQGFNPYLKDSENKTPLDYIKNKKTRNELLFLYKNREKILREIDRQKEKGVERDKF